MSNITGDHEGSFCSGEGQQLEENQLKTMSNGFTSQHQFSKMKRNSPGNPEVIALSPTTLTATNRFVCEICNKGFQRDQNLQLHRRGHNLPWKLKPKSASDQLRKRVYICPEKSCVHHNPSRALGDLTGIKKHYSRKHGEKRWKCEKCGKKYAVQSDWKAHQKTCGTRDYTCYCGAIFSRRDNFMTHKAFCDADEGNHGLMSLMGINLEAQLSKELISTPTGLYEFNDPLISSIPQEFGMFSGPFMGRPRYLPLLSAGLQLTSNSSPSLSGYNWHQDNTNLGSPQMSATALLQKAAKMGSTSSSNGRNFPVIEKRFVTRMSRTDPISGPRPMSNVDCFQAHNEQSSRFLQKSPQEMSHLFGPGGSATTTRNMVVHGDSAARLLINSIRLQDGCDQSSMRRVLGRNNNSNTIERNQSRVGGTSEVMTVDFLGVNGGSRRQNLNDLELEAINQERIRVMNYSLHQYGDSAAEKPSYKRF